MRKRVALVVAVDLDPIPGNFHTEESAHGNIYGILWDRIPHYNPEVEIAPEVFQLEDFDGVKYQQRYFFVYMDLDPTLTLPDVWAKNAVKSILGSVIPHYNPMVTIAHNLYQPTYNIEGRIPA